MSQVHSGGILLHGVVPGWFALVDQGRVINSSRMERAPSRRPGRLADHAAEVAALEGRVLVRKHVSLDVAECRVRLALDAVVEGLHDGFLEVIAARMRMDNC